MARGRQIAAILLTALGLYSFLSLFSDSTGQYGAYVSYWLRRAAGTVAFVPALALVWLGVRLFWGRWDAAVARRLAGVTLLLGVAALGLHVHYRFVTGWPAAWNVRDELAAVSGAAGPWSGGMLGAYLAAASMPLLGPLGTSLAAGAATVVAWLLIADNTMRRLGRRLGRRLMTRASEEDKRKLSIGDRLRKRRPPQTEREAHEPAGVKEAAAAQEPWFPKAARTTADDDERRARDTLERSAAGGPQGPDREQPARRPTNVHYVFPSVELLERPRPPRRRGPAEDDEARARQLEETLASFGVDAKVVSIVRGPRVTRFEVQPPPGIKVSRIVGLADDIALSLAAADVRVEAPVPGKSVVGIEVPNKEASPVYLREIIESAEFQQLQSPLAMALGRDITGKPLVADLTKLLHLLIAGATGSGKSVCLNCIITSFLYKARPDEVKLMMIDPKRVELSVYDGIPHLIAPVVTDAREAAGALKWAVKEMERRYELLSAAGVRNVDSYNRSRRKPEGGDEYLPYLVIVIDELADLMLVAASDVEDSICRLAQMARAAGIYLVIATQRPSVDVITGLIKANVPSRLAFAVSSHVDSRTILDMGGAERLLGKGDMLFYPIGAPKPIRAQGAWVSEAEVEAVADAWRTQAAPQYVAERFAAPNAEGGWEEDMEDELFDEAVRLVREMGQASVSMLQRRFRIGYARAARLIDMMERRGIVGPYQGSKPREVIGVDDGARPREPAR
ncbi:MAG: DNA translocase FtsK [Bacillota bacterium]